MKRLITYLFIGLGLCMALSLQAQEFIDYQFKYEAASEKGSELKEITKVMYAGASSIRLYFSNVKLNEGSYLLLEGEDGSQQKLDAKALENWHNSSAYFNGSEVKVFLYQKASSENSIEINQVKIAKRESFNTNSNQRLTGNVNNKGSNENKANLLNETPQGKAIGRFTDGNNAGGAGWIAPNGAIVTSRVGYKIVQEKGYDIIEFNVPLSNEDGTVNHPAPEDQFPLEVNTASYGSREIKIQHYDAFYYTKEVVQGFAVLRALPNSLGQTPGERQQAYLRIATNPGEFTVKNAEIDIDIFSYGESIKSYPSYEDTHHKTLAVYSSQLRVVKDFVKRSLDDKESILLYDFFNTPTSFGFVNNHTGGPITYKNSNVAIGVQSEVLLTACPSVGLGFKNNTFRNAVQNFMSNHAVYVDYDGLYGDESTGEIHKPYITLGDAYEHTLYHSEERSVVYFSPGNHQTQGIFNAPMKWKAPVGTVRIGSYASNSRMASNGIFPEGFVLEEESEAEENALPSQVSIKGYPNPFAENYELDYVLPASTNVAIRIYDTSGAEVRRILEGYQESGAYHAIWDGRNDTGSPVQTGMYLVKMQLGNTSKTLKIIKN